MPGVGYIISYTAIRILISTYLEMILTGFGPSGRGVTTPYWPGFFALMFDAEASSPPLGAVAAFFVIRTQEQK